MHELAIDLKLNSALLLMYADVKLEVLNVLCDKINEVVSGKQSIGDYKYNLSNLHAGLYFVTLSVNNNITIQSVIVIK